MYSCLCSKVVKFSVRELSDVKRVSSHHLRLLGFKPLDCLKDYHNLRPSTFIYPSDEVTIHSIPRIFCYFVHNLHVSPDHLLLYLDADNLSCKLPMISLVGMFSFYVLL